MNSATEKGPRARICAATAAAGHAVNRAPRDGLWPQHAECRTDASSWSLSGVRSDFSASAPRSGSRYSRSPARSTLNSDVPAARAGCSASTRHPKARRVAASIRKNVRESGRAALSGPRPSAMTVDQYDVSSCVTAVRLAWSPGPRARDPAAEAATAAAAENVTPPARLLPLLPHRTTVSRSRPRTPGCTSTLRCPTAFAP